MPISHNSLGYRLDFEDNLNFFNKGVWTSPWFDTRSAGFSAAWSAYLASQTTPGTTSAAYEFRSASTSSGSDATAWTSTINTLTGRYLQVRSSLTRQDADTTPARVNDITLTLTSVGKGLLLEPAATNSAIYSEGLDNAAWGKIGGSVVANAYRSPANTMTADKVVEDTSAGGHQVQVASFTAAASTYYTFSIYAKAAERSILWLTMTSYGNWTGGDPEYEFDLAAGTATNRGTGSNTGGIVHVGGGWYRIWMTVQSTSAGTFSTRGTVTLCNAANTPSYTGDGVSGLYLWGAQIEASNGSPTSYIATTTVAVTRNADATYVSNNLLNPSSGSIMARAYFSGDVALITTLANHYLFDTQTAGSGREDRLALFRNGNTMVFYVTNEAQASTSITWTVTTAISDGWHWVGVKWDANEASLWFDGEKKATSTVAGLPERFGANFYLHEKATRFMWNDVISDFVILHSALADWQMALYTTLGATPYDKPTYKLNFEDNLNIVVEGIWTSRWRPNRKSPTLKTVEVDVTQPTSTEYVVEHRTAEVGFDDPKTKALSFARGSDARDLVTLALTTTKSHPRYVEIAGTVGLLVEETSTNLVQYSQEFDNAWWTNKVAATISANAAVAPDGTITADKLASDASAGSHRVNKTEVLTIGAAGSFSVYAKAGEYPGVALNFGGSNTTFNLSDGTIISTAGSHISSITSLGNGWYRCSISHTSVPSDARCEISILDGSFSNSFTGVSGQGIYIWGAQAELKAYPTSYIATSGATAARSVDDLKILTSTLGLNNKEGAAVFRCYFDGDLLGTTQASHYVFHPGSGAGDNVYLARAGANLNVGYGASGSVASASWAQAGAEITKGWHTIAVRWSPTEVSAWFNGSKKASATVTSVATLQTYTRLLQAISAASSWGQPVAWAAIYTIAPTDSEMASIVSSNKPTDAQVFYDFTQQTLIPQLGHDLASEWKTDITDCPESDYIQHRIRLFSNNSAQVPEVTRLAVTPI